MAGAPALSPQAPLFETPHFPILLREGEIQITKTQQMVFINSYFLAAELPLISSENYKGNFAVLPAA